MRKILQGYISLQQEVFSGRYQQLRTIQSVNGSVCLHFQFYFLFKRLKSRNKG